MGVFLCCALSCTESKILHVFPFFEVEIYLGQTRQNNLEVNGSPLNPAVKDLDSVPFLPF